MKIGKLLIAFSLSTFCWGQTGIEQKVLQQIQEMMKSSGGRVTFSDLHNSPQFSADEKAFLGNLYEAFFKLPSQMKSSLESLGRVPTRAELGSALDLSSASIELLLRVMESDSRVPPLFERDPSSREIKALNLANIDSFVKNRGDQVKMNAWEGKTIPAFELPTLWGGSFSSSELNGKPAMLYFWFSGCPPCVRIAPILAQLDRLYRDAGFRIVGLNADKMLGITIKESQRAEYLGKTGTEYLNLELDEGTHKEFGSVNVYPTLFLIDRKGVVVKHLLNFQDRDTLSQIIETLLAQPAS